MSGGRRDKLKTQGDLIGIGESSVDYTGSVQKSQREQLGGAVTSSMADVEAMLKLQQFSSPDAQFGHNNSQMQQSTAEERSSIQDPHSHNAINFREGWAPIER